MHIDTRLSEHVELGATRREIDDVEVVTTDGGNETRNARWSQPLLEFDISFPPSVRDDAVFLEVRAAYRACRGRLHSFKFRDWSDYEATDELFATGDGTTTIFPLIKAYAFGTETFERRIYQPVSAIALKKNGVAMLSGYAVDYDTGEVTFTIAPVGGETPDEISWTGEFDVPVRFDTDLASTGIAPHLEHHETVTLKEVRL